MNTEHRVLDKVVIKHLTLPNRAVVAPMTRVSTKGDGVVTNEMAQYYRRYAQGGFALIITEGVYTDKFYSQAYPNQPGIVTLAQQKAWKAVVDAIHEEGGKVFLQLMHGGALSQHLSNTRSASSIMPLRKMLAGYSERQGEYPLPQAMNLSEIDDVIKGFSDSATIAQTIGFDGVEVHAANGYLLDQFLTDYTNTREDFFGGSVENRCRLTAKVIQQIKAGVSAEFIVGVRVSQGKVNDFDYAWPGGINDGEVIFALLENAGADYIHFASEGKGFNHACLTNHGESLPQLAKKITQLPVIANGGLENVDEAERILQEGHGDMVALGSGALANPDWPRKIQRKEAITAFTPAMFEHGVTIEKQMAWENE